MTYGFSSSRPDVYRAQAALAFSDQSADLSILGGASARSTEPDQLAAAKADTVTRPELLTRVRDRLQLSISVGQLAQRLSTGVEPTSNLVLVTASAPAAGEAAGIANAVAAEAVSVALRDTRERYRAAARGVTRRLAELGDGPSAAVTRLGLQEQLSRLESLSALAQPATIARRANIPGGPSAPNPVRNSVIAGVFGLLVAIIASLYRGSFDRRVRDPDDIASALDLPLLATIGEDTLGHVAGVGDESAGQAADGEAFRILRTSLLFLARDRDLVTLAVTSAMPQEGKTTVAASLAWASASAGRSTLLIECDCRRPTLAARLDISQSPGLADYLGGRATFEDILQTVPLSKPSGDGNTGVGRDATDAVTPTRFMCITAGGPTRQPAELLGGQAFSAFLQEVQRTFDLVVLDTCPLLPVVDTLHLIPLVDGVVLCVRSAQTTSDQVLAAKAALLRFTGRALGVVVTGLDRHGQRQYGYYGAYPASGAP